MWKLRKLWTLWKIRQKAARLAKRAVDRISQAGSNRCVGFTLVKIIIANSQVWRCLIKLKGVNLKVHFNDLQCTFWLMIDELFSRLHGFVMFCSFNEQRIHHARKNIMACRFFPPLSQPWIRNRHGMMACAKRRWRAGSPIMQETQARYADCAMDNAKLIGLSKTQRNNGLRYVGVRPVSSLQSDFMRFAPEHTELKPQHYGSSFSSCRCHNSQRCFRSELRRTGLPSLHGFAGWSDLSLTDFWQTLDRPGRTRWMQNDAEWHRQPELGQDEDWKVMTSSPRQTWEIRTQESNETKSSRELKKIKEHRTKIN